jgi:hypothetical protein
VAISHADRLVSEVDWQGFELAPITRSSALPLVGMVVVNPVGAQRSTNPANLAAFTREGLGWVLPVDRSRLTVAKDANGSLQPAFDRFWLEVTSAAGRMTGGAIWEPGHPVGCRGVEIGATGTRPNGHPWLSLLELPSGLHIVCPVSARAGDAERSYQAWFDAGALVDLAGAQLNRKAGVLNPGDGAVEIAHFAAVSPAEEGWTRVATMQPGNASCAGLMHVVDKFARRWPQTGDSRVLYACPASLPDAAKCDDCAGR